MLRLRGCLHVENDRHDIVDTICGEFGKSLEEIIDVFDGINIANVKNYFKFREEKSGHWGIQYNIRYTKIADKYYRVICYHQREREVDDDNISVSDHRYIASVESVQLSEIEMTNEMKGIVEVLWDRFGGTINENNKKVLADNMRVICSGDISTEKEHEIYDRLNRKGFDISNVILGDTQIKETYPAEYKNIKTIVTDSEVMIAFNQYYGY